VYTEHLSIMNTTVGSKEVWSIKFHCIINIGNTVLWLYKRVLNYLSLQSFDFERNWWKLFQKYAVHIKLDIYVFIYNVYLQWHLRWVFCQTYLVQNNISVMFIEVKFYLWRKVEWVPWENYLTVCKEVLTNFMT
jgi:hypothetical protein